MYQGYQGYMPQQQYWNKNQPISQYDGMAQPTTQNQQYAQQNAQQPQYQVQQQSAVQPLFSTVQPMSNLYGKVVESVEVAKAIDIPISNNTNYFPLADNSLIVTKRLNPNGTSNIVIFKPIEFDNQKKETPNYITQDDFMSIKEDLDLIKKDISSLKEIKKPITKEVVTSEPRKRQQQ